MTRRRLLAQWFWSVPAAEQVRYIRRARKFGRMTSVPIIEDNQRRG
jgi:hypothetical protein